MIESGVRQFDALRFSGLITEKGFVRAGTKNPASTGLPAQPVAFVVLLLFYTLLV
jgi:hypothetical protein